MRKYALLVAIIVATGSPSPSHASLVEAREIRWVAYSVKHHDTQNHLQVRIINEAIVLSSPKVKDLNLPKERAISRGAIVKCILSKTGLLKSCKTNASFPEGHETKWAVEAVKAFRFQVGAGAPQIGDAVEVAIEITDADAKSRVCVPALCLPVMPAPK